MAKKKSAGRPPHKPTETTRGMVEMLVAAGLSQDEIAIKMRIAPNTLAKHYNHELKVGWVTGVADATTVVFETMRNGELKDRMDAAKFFLTRRGKGLWTDTKNVELSGPNGGPIQTKTLNIEALDYEEREQLEAMLTAALALPSPTEDIQDADYEEIDDEDA